MAQSLGPDNRQGTGDTMATLGKDVKGKGRATETTPLLSDGAPSPSSHTEQTAVDVDVDHEQQHVARPQTPHHALRRTLLNVFLGSLTVVVVLFVLGVLLIYSYAQRVRRADPDHLATSIIWRGPSSMDVLEMEQGGHVVMEIKGLIGVDTNSILGFQSEDDDQDGLFTSLWKDIGRWGVGLLRQVSVDLGEVVIYNAGRDDPLAWTYVEPFTVRLTSNPGRPWDASWLKPITFRVLAVPSQDADLIQRFAQETWESGVVDLQFNVDQVRVQGGSIKGDGGWRNLVKATQTNVTAAFHYTGESNPAT